MAYQTGTATDSDDLLEKWFNFLQANGWTADIDYSGAPSPSYGVIQRKVQPDSPNKIETEVNLHCGYGRNLTSDNINIHPMRDYAGSGDIDQPANVTEGACPTQHTYDNGGIALNGPSLNIPDPPPYDAYHFFAGDYYAHAVVEYKTGFFRHWGMGQLVKVGRYIGGEYYYGGYWNQNNTYIDSPINDRSAVGMDGRSSSTAGDIGPRLYAKKMDGSRIIAGGTSSPVEGWYVGQQPENENAGNDLNGNSVGNFWVSGPRGGFSTHKQLWDMGQSAWNGYQPLFPIHCFGVEASIPNQVIPLGTVPDMRNVQLSGDLQPGDEFTVGVDTWKVFPCIRKRFPVVSDNTEQSGLFGIAYKKVV